MSSFDSKSIRGLDSRLEHIPDHRGQLAFEPLKEHLTRQFGWPGFWITHLTVELLSKDPLPIVFDEKIKILERINALDKVDARVCAQFLEDRSWPVIVCGVRPIDIRPSWTDDQGGAFDCARMMAKQHG